jgi:MFS family permease
LSYAVHRQLVDADGVEPAVDAVFRLLQGFAGGGMVPVAQSILALRSHHKRSQAFACSVAVVVAPVVGPSLAAGSPTISRGAGAS